MADPLNFGNGSNPFAAFDAAPALDQFDLSAFDKADGKLVVPAGWYVCRVDRGELTTTKTGKTAYRLKLSVVAPAEHAGFVLWRWFVLADPAGCNRAAAALKPLGLASSAALRAPFPPPGQDVYLKALVTIRPAKDGFPESNDVDRLALCDPPAAAPAPAPPAPPTGPTRPLFPGQEEGGSIDAIR